MLLYLFKSVQDFNSYFYGFIAAVVDLIVGLTVTLIWKGPFIFYFNLVCFWFEPDYMMIFSPGWNFAPPTGLKYCCDHMLDFSPGAKC